MIELPTNNGEIVIINISDITLIKAHGNKTAVFIKGFENPIFSLANILEVKEIMEIRGLFNGKTKF